MQNINHDVNNDESIEGEEIFDNAVACERDEKLNYFIEIPLIDQIDQIEKLGEPWFDTKFSEKSFNILNVIVIVG